MENKAKYMDLIIFDLDGTLVDSRQDIVDAVNFTLRKIGLKEKSKEEIISFVGTGVKDLMYKSLGKYDENLFNRMLSTFKEYYKEHLTDKTRPYPGVKEMLECFKDKRKAIITNRNHDFALVILKDLGMYDYFEEILGGDDEGCIKPSSCPLDKMIGGFNVDKDKTIIVGDMSIDVLAGKNTGIHTCAVTYGIGRREDILKANPDYVIDDILKLKEIIK